MTEKSIIRLDVKQEHPSGGWYCSLLSTYFVLSRTLGRMASWMDTAPFKVPQHSLVWNYRDIKEFRFGHSQVWKSSRPDLVCNQVLQTAMEVLLNLEPLSLVSPSTAPNQPNPKGVAEKSLDQVTEFLQACSHPSTTFGDREGSRVSWYCWFLAIRECPKY